jgi:hypothetical protein
MSNILPTISDQYSIKNQTATDIRYKFVAKEESFNVAVNGLKPLTIHHLFFEREKVSASQIKPLNGSLGDQLQTDASGKLEFIFYYKSNIIPLSSAEQYNSIIQRIGGSKELIIVNTSSAEASISDNFRNEYTSYAIRPIFFKTQLVSELPVNTNYSLAYPSQLVDDEERDWGDDADNE